jgi:hypothetical protein
MSADGHGLLLTFANGSPWQPGNGGSGPVREWTTDNWGLTWTKGTLLPLGKDTLDGPASFTYSAQNGWSGWVSVANASFSPQIAAFTGGSKLSVLPGSPPTDNVQLIAPGAGFAWGVNYVGKASVLVIARTSDGGKAWQLARLTLPSSFQGEPLLSFSNMNDGWLVIGSTTLRTSDGGLTWQPL